ncbi:MAG: ribosome biogenesis GTPase Der [Candidatus Omnitrophica bacterium]|nr:ribosome biogenesis GTPase Der [Candidatus Omnitrophota bacterium]
MALPLLAIVGRPNVGKSTLFNRLLGRRIAVVAPQRGTTRDRVYGRLQWRGKDFRMVDMGGMEFGRQEGLAAAIQRHVGRALAEADEVLFLCDAQEGVVPVDEMIAERLRTTGKPVLLVVNKADRGPAVPPEFYRLGFTPIMAVSALHGLGTGDLLDRVVQRLPARPGAADAEAAYVVAILGRPNVGKSSLLNALLKEERMIVSEAPGTTRDAVETRLQVNAEAVALVDTAGLKHKRKVKSPVEVFSMARSVEALRRCDVALVVLDAAQSIARDDRRLIAKVCETGKPLMLLANKWDLVRSGSEVRLKAATARQVPMAAFAPVLAVSAKTGFQVGRILPAARRMAQAMRRGLSPQECLALVQPAWQTAHPVPRLRGRAMRLTGARWLAGPPPRIELAIAPRGPLPRTLLQYLTGRCHASIKLAGIPVRVITAGAPQG